MNLRSTKKSILPFFEQLCNHNNHHHNNNNSHIARTFQHVYFSTTTSGGDDDDEKKGGDETNKKKNVGRANPIFDLAREELKKKEIQRKNSDAETTGTSGDVDDDDDFEKPFNIHDYEAELKKQEEEEEANSNNSGRDARRGIKREQNKDLEANYSTLAKMLNVALHVGISPYDVKKEFELQYDRKVNKEEAILISDIWNKFQVNEKHMNKLHTYAKQLRKEITLKDRRDMWNTNIMTPEEMEQEKTDSLQGLVRDFTSLDTQHELKMLQSPEMFFHHDTAFENEDMNDDDGKSNVEEDELKLVGGKLVRSGVHDTLYAATERTLALEALTPKPVAPIRYQSTSWLMNGISRGRGSRKSSSAAVQVVRGDGKITINKMPFIEYFSRTSHRNIVLSPFSVTETLGQYDVEVTCKGGGTSGQAQSVRMAIARALQEIDPAFRPVMKREGFLTRDPRKVERKKPGRAKARKRYQWVKR
eukprot:g7712.t1